MRTAEEIATDEIRAALRDHMSAISEELWCEGWTVDLEYILWPYAAGEADGEQRRDFGIPPSPEDVARLRELHVAAGGWWIWDDEKRFLTTAEWLATADPERLAAARRDAVRASASISSCVGT